MSKRIGAVVSREGLIATIWISLSFPIPALAHGEAPRSVPSAPQGVIFSGGDGNGCDRAVVIRGAKGTRDAVAAEIAWLRSRYPGYKFRDNAVETREKRSFEQITIETVAGEKKTVCFDVTEGFGVL